MDNFIFINKLQLHGFHGIEDIEKEKGQIFEISLKAYYQNQLDLQDEIQNATNYVELLNLIESSFKKKRFNLVETLCEEIVFAVLNQFPPISKVTINIHKPELQLQQKTHQVGVSLSREKSQCFIALGANLGNKEENITTAIDMIEKIKHTTIGKKSKLYTTKPFEVEGDQPDYLNGVIKIETLLSPYQLLSQLQGIEDVLGRTRSHRYDARLIDIDILTYNHLVLYSSELTLPHIGIQYRSFVLDPWVSIEPDYIHPVYHKTIRQLKKELDES